MPQSSHIRFTLALALPFLLSLEALADDAAEIQSDVHATFKTYKKAILEGDGAAAYRAIDQNTRDYYDRLLADSHSATKQQIEKMGLIDKMQIIVMRHRVPKDQLLAMDGKALFIHAVDKGYVGKDGASKLDIGKVTATGKFANAVAVVGGVETPLRLHFHQEADGWKLDVAQMSKLGEAVFLKLAKDSGMSENDYIFYLVRIVSGKPVQDSVWEPLK